MVRARLNELYGNDFLTTLAGQVFYHKNNKINKEYNTEEINLDNTEIKMLVNQGILIIDNSNINLKKEVKQSVSNEPVDVIEEKPKMESKMLNEKIITDKPNKKTIKEIKTESNDKELEDFEKDFN